MNNSISPVNKLKTTFKWGLKQRQYLYLMAKIFFKDGDG